MTTRKTSRRLFLAAGSATAVFGALATAAEQEHDPIFAAMERLKTAWAAYSDSCDLTDNVAREEKGETVSEADEAIHELARAEWDEAEAAFVATIPTTLAGARAAIAYLIKYDDGCVPDVSGSFLPSLLASPIFGGVA